MKKQASSNNGQDVQLRALEREAKAQRDLLESYLAKYREANTRENIEAAPADGRIISRAIVSNTPAYPKKLPIVLIATLATLLLTAGAIVTGELLRMTAPRPPSLRHRGGRLRSTFRRSRPRAGDRARASGGRRRSAALREPVFAPAPVLREPHLRMIPATDVSAELDEIEQLADALVGAGAAARKVTVLGTASSEGITLTALTLARLMARQAKIVVVDLVGVLADDRGRLRRSGRRPGLPN